MADASKKTMIVALARKLLVALWKYVNAGIVIEGGPEIRLTADSSTAKLFQSPGPDQP